MKKLLLTLLVVLFSGSLVFVGNSGEIEVEKPQITDPSVVAEVVVSPSPSPVASASGEVAGKTTVKAKATTVTGEYDVYLIGKINELRKSKGLSELKGAPKLSQAAQCRINYMKDTGVFSHNNFRACFTANGVSPHFGENLGTGYGGNDDTVFNAWVNSPSHYANMVNKNWKYVSVIKEGGYWVTAFSTR